MRIAALCGGIGGARFLLGLRTLGHDVTAIVNTGDDLTVLGLRICPDLDSVVYTLGGGISAERGWGRDGETFRVRDELAAYAGSVAAAEPLVPHWFGLGDLDLATHLLRTRWLADGVSLSTVTQRLCERWHTGLRVIPASDDWLETHVQLSDGSVVHFQEWWVRMQAQVPATGFEVRGSETAKAAPGVTAAINGADVVLLAPSNPVVSIGSILAVPGIAAAVRETRATVVGLSPIVGGSPVRGMADACLAAIGVETAADAVAHHYGARRSGGLIDGWLVDETDGDLAAPLAAAGFACRAVPLLMHDVAATAAMARAAVDLAVELA
ncbi:MAG TPA: 2-phospho-L-lactate transferase [Mycobacteriales bacterium]|jgi:LPPG:FO 2-phospho-L-lactate transferase|nr:2-phospho-L-lactate transferase [Mycobacteriales bacterium]HVX69922.1 2-phospho-L-lactate transferase [Mycobacteriales bacterium]